MNIIKVFLYFTLCLFVLSCQDDVKELNLNGAYLKQTQWVGTFNESYIGSMGAHISATASTGFFFESENHGRYSMKWENLSQANESPFEYTIDDKLFIISNGDYLNGTWLITKFDSNKLVLEKGTNGEGAYKCILTLERDQ